MERLTHEADFGFEDWEETLFFVKSDPNGAYNILDIAKHQGEPEFDEILKNVALRLAAYENADLEPETISKIRDIVLDISGNLDRLRELAQADRDGRCVVVPVKLGQPVYCLQDYFNDATMKSEKRVKCRLVDFIPVASKLFESNGLIYQFSEIGKTVFLTREEAEAKLKERENNG